VTAIKGKILLSRQLIDVIDRTRCVFIALIEGIDLGYSGCGYGAGKNNPGQELSFLTGGDHIHQRQKVYCNISAGVLIGNLGACLSGEMKNNINPRQEPLPDIA